MPQGQARSCLEIRRICLNGMPANFHQDVAAHCAALFLETIGKQDEAKIETFTDVTKAVCAIASHYNEENKEKLLTAAAEVHQAFKVDQLPLNETAALQHARSLQYAIDPTLEPPRYIQTDCATIEVPKMPARQKEEVLCPYLWVDHLATKGVDEVTLLLSNHIANFFGEQTRHEFWQLMRERAEDQYTAFLKTAADFVASNMIIPLHLWRIGFNAAVDLLLVKAAMTGVSQASLLAAVEKEWRKKKIDLPKMLQTKFGPDEDKKKDDKQDKKDPPPSHVPPQVRAPTYLPTPVPVFGNPFSPYGRGGNATFGRGGRGGRGGLRGGR